MVVFSLILILGLVRSLVSLSFPSLFRFGFVDFFRFY